MAAPAERFVQHRHPVGGGAGSAAAFSRALAATPVSLERAGHPRLFPADSAGFRTHGRGWADSGQERVQTSRSTGAGCLGDADRWRSYHRCGAVALSEIIVTVTEP